MSNPFAFLPVWVQIALVQRGIFPQHIYGIDRTLTGDYLITDVSGRHWIAEQAAGTVSELTITLPFGRR